LYQNCNKEETEEEELWEGGDDPHKNGNTGRGGGR
jgi:hypothetical protein